MQINLQEIIRDRKKMCLDGAYLWLATQGTGLYKVNLSDLSYERFSIDDVASGIPTNVVMDVIKDKAGNIYAATDGDGLFVYDPIKNAFKPDWTVPIFFFFGTTLALEPSATSPLFLLASFFLTSFIISAESSIA